ncbi:hypothetical protein [Rhodoferax sp.]|uniref:hypothetical protein n=1 Tax=Rhodoferax sp. TaxID=50421 RepID=UPI00275CA74A|nr:hypothetical protein [Rhodoferax sp.]
MSKKFNEEQFQEFVVEQFGKLTTELSEVRSGVASVRSELRAGLIDVRSEIVAVQVEMQTGFREIRSEISGIKEILEPLAKAFDNDAETIIEHDRRISRLEGQLGIAK